jgi:AraC family transcriptional regulator of adaptative response/methylated-DNA-[protein]-cysteine methyltransferase
VYAVSSTRIYCRPSCASRRPTRSHVEFFNEPGEAERAGYRPCRRCRPNEPTAPDPWIDKIRLACRYLANIDGRPTLATLARHVGGSPYHLQRKFKRFVGVTPREFADACRLKTVREQLRRGVDVTTAVVSAGYGSSSRFYERGASKLAMAPATYKRGGAGMEIRYAIVDSPLDRLLVAATNRGVCAIALGTDDGRLEQGLKEEYPAAELSRDQRALSDTLDRVLDHLEGRLPRLDLPLDIRATSFQWQVWTALRAIPRGETRTYGDVAASIGRPRAARAVARACATNPVAVAIPCHRAVPAKGGRGGFRWGSARKEQLLAREGRGERTLQT